jgi:hypothetical protein
MWEESNLTSGARESPLGALLQASERVLQGVQRDACLASSTNSILWRPLEGLPLRIPTLCQRRIPYHIFATSLFVTAGAACVGHQKVVTLPETGRYGFAAYGSCPAAVTGPPVHCPLDGFCG